MPFNITTGIDANGDTLFTERPSFVTNASEPGILETKLGMFDPTPDPGDVIIPRNYGRGPEFFVVNLRTSKEFGFGGGEKKSAAARAVEVAAAAVGSTVLLAAAADRAAEMTTRANTNWSLPRKYGISSIILIAVCRLETLAHHYSANRFRSPEDLVLAAVAGVRPGIAGLNWRSNSVSEYCLAQDIFRQDSQDLQDGRSKPIGWTLQPNPTR